MTRNNLNARRNLGVKALDRDHDALSDHLGSLENALGVSDFDPGEVETALVELLAHIKEHFEREESWMRRINYPGMRFHAKQHQCLIEAIEEFRQAFSSNPTRDKGEYVYSMVEDLLVEHTLKADRVIGGFVGYRRQIFQN